MSSWLSSTPSTSGDDEPGPNVKYELAASSGLESSAAVRSETSWLGRSLTPVAETAPERVELPPAEPPTAPATSSEADWYVPTKVPPPRAGPFLAINRPLKGIVVGPRVTTRALLLAAVERDPLALLGLSDELKNDREFVKMAVAHEGCALQHASTAMRGNREVVLTAVLQDGRALEYASDALKRDMAICTAACEENGYALGYCPDYFRDHAPVATVAVSRDGGALEFASAAMRGDRAVVLAAVGSSGEALQFASRELRADRDVALKAVRVRRA